MLICNHNYINGMKISKQLQKLKTLNVKAEACLTREEARKIINKSKKAQSKITL